MLKTMSSFTFEVFVIPGDDLVAFTEAGDNGEWTSVMYMAKNGDDYSGWVRTDRLRFMAARRPGNRHRRIPWMP